MKKAIAIGALAGAVAATACARPLSETDLPCPCQTGWTCCPFSLTCEPTLTACSPGGASCSAADGGFVETSRDVILDGGSPDGIVKLACGDSTEALSHTRGLGLDITRAVGYAPDPTIPAQAAALLDGGVSVEANQMRGTPPADQQTRDIYRTLDDTAHGILGARFRDGSRGVNLVAPIYAGPFGYDPLDDGPGYATVFPVAAARGAAWDVDLEAQIGRDVADEALASYNTMILAPDVDLLRHPAWGRAQESYGEDAFAVGRMGTAFVDGAQEYIPACVKDLAAYNIETDRVNQISVMDSQTLHEVYGRPFEMAVQDGGAACVVAAYNHVQVTDLDDQSPHDAENHTLLDGMLRGAFGFAGFVVSDFFAMDEVMTTGLPVTDYYSYAQTALAAGLDMEMPWSLSFAYLEQQAAGDDAIAAQMQASATRILEQKLRFRVAKIGQPVGLKPPTTKLGPRGIECNDGHVADAELQTEESMVLLKNDHRTLPIRSPVHDVVVVGATVPWTLTAIGQSGSVDFATDPRIGDLGSSSVALAPKAIGPYDGIRLAAQARGMTVTKLTCSSIAQCSDPTLAESADFVVVLAGLTPEDEGDAYTGAGDRTDSTTGAPRLGLDPKFGRGNHPELVDLQNTLVDNLAARHKPMVVVLEGGSSIDMPWLDSVPAVVMAWYPGQAGGTALGRLLVGDVSFSGKLPITWPKSESDEPPFMGDGKSTMMDYYVGYRYFDENGLTPLFAFGSGLSYTTFRYDYLGVPCSTVTKNGVVDVQVAVTNTGPVAGSEVTFLFVAYPETTARRSVKELKGFHRTPTIQPGQTVELTIPLRIQDLKYWNSAATPPGWTVESGPVRIMVGGSSDNLPLQDTLTVQ